MPMRVPRSKLFHAWFWASLAMNLAAWALVFAKIAPLRRERGSFVLHATVYFGIDRIGPWTGTLIPAAVGLAVLAVNTAAALFLFGARRPIAQLVGIVTACVQAFTLLSVIELIRLNTV